MAGESLYVAQGAECFGVGQVVVGSCWGWGGGVLRGVHRSRCGRWLACDNGLSAYISVPAVTATYGSALTAGHFWKGPKVTKRPSPHHSAPRPGSVCPNAGFAAWAAAMGHPWPSAANPASCRVTHAAKPAFGQRGLTGRFQIKSRARRPYSRPGGKGNTVRHGGACPRKPRCEASGSCS